MMLLRQSTHRMTVQYHPRLGFHYVPNLNARIPNELGGYFVRTNALGFRSDVEFSHARNGRRRVLFFGDSYTAGDGCDNQQRFAERLGEELDTEVFNYGLSGSGTDQQLLIFEEYARGVEADLIVLCITVENIERIAATHRESIDRVAGKRVLVPKPYFTLQHNELCLHHVPVPRERPDVPFVAIRSDEHWLRRGIEWYRHSPVIKGLTQSIATVTSGVRGRLLRATGFQPYAAYTSADHPGWRLMQAIVERFHASTGGIPLLIVPIPNYYFYLHGVRPLYQELFSRLDAPSRGRHVVDLTQPLCALPEETRERLSFRHDSHFSPFGHDQVAQLLKREIVSRQLLPLPGRASGTPSTGGAPSRKPT